MLSGPKNFVDSRPSTAISIAHWDKLEDRCPSHAKIEDIDLVVIRWDDQVSVLYGRCLHEGALLSEGKIDGDNLVCKRHGWFYPFVKEIYEHGKEESVPRFPAWIEKGKVWVEPDVIVEWVKANLNY